MTRRLLALAVCLCVSFVARIASSAEPTRFCVTADNKGYKGFAQVLGAIKQAEAGPGQFMLSPGDIAPADYAHRQIQEAFGKPFPWFVAIGNHDVADRDSLKYLADYYDSDLKSRANAGPDLARNTVYSFDAGNVHVAIVNEYWDGRTAFKSSSVQKGGFATTQLDWLRKDLKAASKPWKIVVGHVPAFPQPDKDWDVVRHAADVLTEHVEQRDAFWSVLEEQGVAIYFCGHTHRYSRYQHEKGRVWQVDCGLARLSSDWKYDTFILAAATEQTLKLDVYRSLKAKGKFAKTDTLELTRTPATSQPAG